MWILLIWLFSEGLYFNATFDIIVSLFCLGISFKMPEPAPQLCKTAKLCPPLPSDGSVGVIGTMPTRVLERLFPSSCFPPLTEMCESFSRNTIHCLQQKQEVTMFNFIRALCSCKVAIGSRNPFTFYSPFGIQDLANQLTAKTSAFADSERCC